LRTSRPTSADGIEKYLSSGMIRGVGPAYAKKLLRAFGDKVFDIIEATPDRLREVDGIGPLRASRITAAWAEQKAVREIMVFLHSHSVDTARAVRIYKTPILRDFEKETGIRVRAIYDTEETRSTGAMNRLIAEKNNPQADVYWANEPIRAEVLRQQGIAASYISPNAEGIAASFKNPDGYWTGFAARARVLIVNKNA